MASAVYGLAASRSLTLRGGVVHTGFLLWGLLTLAAGAAVITAGMLLGNGIDFPVASAALAGAGIGIFCVRLCWRVQLVRASWVAVVGSVAVFAPLLQWVLPDLQALWLSPAAAAAAQQAGADGSRPLVAVGKVFHLVRRYFVANLDLPS